MLMQSSVDRAIYRVYENRNTRCSCIPWSSCFTSTAETSRVEISQQLRTRWSSFACYWQVITFHGLCLATSFRLGSNTMVSDSAWGGRKDELSSLWTVWLYWKEAAKHMWVQFSNKVVGEGNCRQFTVTFNVKLLQNFAEWDIKLL